MRFQLSFQHGVVPLLAGLILTAANFSCAAVTHEPTGQPSGQHVIRSASSPVVIDGRLDETAWQTALKFDRFNAVGREAGMTPPVTIARLTYDADALLIAFVCDEPDPSRIKANVNKHDGKVWAEDCVEIFLDVAGKGTSYAHLAINAKGVIYDAWREAGQPADVGWNSHAQVATTTHAAGWRIEIRIPWEHLPMGHDATAWRIQLGRSRTSSPRNLTMLSSPITGFHVPNQFETMQGLDALQRPVHVKQVMLGDRLPGRNVAVLTLENQSASPQPVSASLWLDDAQSNTRELMLAPGAQERIELPYALPAGDDKRVRLAAFTGRRPLGSIDQPARPATVMNVTPHMVMMTPPRQPGRVIVPISLARDSLTNARVEWKLIDRENQRQQVGRVSVVAGIATIEFMHHQHGPHSLELTLVWDTQSRLTRQVELYLVPGPFDEQ